jgi:flavodoxin
MRILVVYYSRTRTTHKVAVALAERLEARIEEICDSRERGGALGFVKCGHEAVRKIEPNINEPVNDPAKFDLVILGTPVWAGTMASPVRTYLKCLKGKFPPVACFVTQQSPKTQRVFGDIKDLLGQELAGTLILTTKEVAQGNYNDKVEEFADRVKSVSI